MRTWRKEPIKAARSGKITSYRLVSGRGNERIRLNLGPVTEAQATICEMNMNIEEKETFGTAAYDRVFQLAERQEVMIPNADPGESHLITTGGLHAVVRVLLGDVAIKDLSDFFGPGSTDYGKMFVSDYWEKHYWPARTNPESVCGISASNAATELLRWKQTGTTQTGKPRPKRGILDGVIASTRMRDLTSLMWEQWITAQKHLSPRTKAIYRNAYAQMLVYARRMGHTTHKPEFFEIRGSTLTTRPKSAPLTLAEVYALLENSTSPMYRCLWAVGVAQGPRPGELVRMHWEDMDWVAKTMLIRGTKTQDSWARVPLTPLAYRELHMYWKLLGEPKFGPCWLYNNKPFISYKKSLANDAKAAGIERKVTPYLLRHSFATIAFLCRVEKEVTRRIGRWTDDAMLDDVYCNPGAGDLVERAAMFDFPEAK
jgi:integrase